MRAPRLALVLRLARKELVSLARDPVLVILVVYAVTYAVYVPATTSGMEMRNASVAVVDEDRSLLSQRLRDALAPPWFLPPATLTPAAIDPAMESGRYTFVLDVPPDFEEDVLAGRRPTLQVLVDATAMSQAGIGAGYLQRIVGQTLLEFTTGERSPPSGPADVVVRAAFNPNVRESWYMGVIELIDNITMLAVVLTGAALLREREHGTLEHLLVMPLRPAEIALAKVAANGLVIVVAAALSLRFVVAGALGVPIHGSVALFLAGTVLYLFSTTAVGIFLATVARSMPQFGLLIVPVIIPMIVLSGGFSPVESMPRALQHVMAVMPSKHFVTFATAVLSRGAGLDVVWRPLLAIAALGALFFGAALVRFRASVAAAGS